MGQKEDNLIKKIRTTLAVRMNLVLLAVITIVLAGGGLLVYLNIKREESSPVAGKVFIALLVFNLLYVIYLLIRSSMNMKQLEQVTADKERMEHELDIARAIQMSMIPKIFPPFPERSDLDMYAAIIPAKEVGGDLYDFFIRDDMLFFCVGDVSGKGVPASLVMAVSRSLFRTVSVHEKSPAKIVTLMNRSMSDMNDASMFVTFFCGVLDLHTGHLRYCNAGHNTPLLLTDRIDNLPVEANIPLGVDQDFRFAEQETDLRNDDALFLYTDGVTEAENARHEQFGERRVRGVLSTRRSSQGHVEALGKAISEFVGGADPSDDLTMLFIHYTNDMEPDATERHLILHNDIQQIPQLADFVETIAQDKKLDQSLAMSLNLALEEAVSNVIMYAYPEGADGLVDVEAIIRKSSIDFIVTDNGMPFDPTSTATADVSAPLEKRQIGGLGIFLVRSIMDEVSYERKDAHNILKMTKRL